MMNDLTFAFMGTVCLALAWNAFEGAGEGVVNGRYTPWKLRLGGIGFAICGVVFWRFVR